jgi:hypothetical protein
VLDWKLKTINLTYFMSRDTQQPGERKTVLLPDYFDINDWDEAINSEPYDLATEVLDLRAGNRAFQDRVDDLEQRNGQLEKATTYLKGKLEESNSTSESQKRTSLRQVLDGVAKIQNLESQITQLRVTGNIQGLETLIVENQRLIQARAEIARDLMESQLEITFLGDQANVYEEVFLKEYSKIQRENEGLELELKLARKALKTLTNEIQTRGAEGRRLYAQQQDQIEILGGFCNDALKVNRLLEKSLYYLRNATSLISVVAALGFIAYVLNVNNEKRNLLSEFSESQVKQCIQKIIDKNGEDVNARYENGYIRFDFPKGKNTLEVPDCDAIPSSRITSLE